MAGTSTSTGGSFVTGLLVGAAAGAALALLYTPRSGRRALEILRSRGIDVPALGEEALRMPRERIGQAAEEARQAAGRTRQDLMDRYESAKTQGHTE
jgi:gas vesicle protein